MRICLVTSSFLPVVGGVEWKVHYLATEYHSRGHDVTVIAPRPQWSERHTPLPVTPTYRLLRVGYTGRGFGRTGLTDVLARRAIAREHRRRPFDILHCHHLGMPTAWGAWARARFGLPVVATTCGDDVFAVPELQYGARLQPRLDRVIRQNVRRIDVIGSISRAIRAELMAIGTTARIVDIPNGVPWREFQTGPSRLLRDRLRLDDEDLIVLSVGRNVNFKRYDLGVQAFARVAARFPKAFYVLIGRDLAGLVPLIEQLGMQGRVLLVGEVHLSQVALALHSADIFFNPSMREGFAQVNAQALASGLPCVVTDAPGNHDAADYGGALVARSEDIDSMAENLAALLGNPGQRRQLGRDALAASRHYDWSRISEQYLDVFDDLLSQRSQFSQASASSVPAARA